MREDGQNASEMASFIENFGIPNEFSDAIDKNGVIRSKITSLGDKIGAGPHSVVYKGEQAGTGRIVAIKVDKRPLVSNYREIQKKINILKQLNHPRIVKLVDFVPDWENNQSYFIMEYVPGKSLNTALAEEGNFKQSRVLDWACQILDILDYLHTDLHVNGNVSLSNLIWKLSDFHNHIYMVDFSYLMKGNYQAETMVHDVFGEAQSKEEFQANVREDIYRVGCLLFQLLTGEDIEKRKNTLEKKEKPLRDDWKQVRLRAEGVFQSVIEIILKATADDPKERYQSAHEMLDALTALPTQDIKKSRIRWLLGIFAASLVFFSTGAALFFMGQYQQRRQLDMNQYAFLSAEAQANGDYTAALNYARQAVNRRSCLDPPCTAQAQAALTNILGVYDVTPNYKPLYSMAALRGMPLQARLSPDGSKTAVLVNDYTAVPRINRIQIFDTESGKELVSSLTLESASPPDCLFLNDDVLLYAKDGVMSAFSVSQSADLWTGFSAASLALSADGFVAASISADSQTLCLYDTRSYASAQIPMRGVETFPVDEGGENSRLFVLNRDGTRLAVSFPDGSLRLYAFSAPGVPGDGSNYQEIVAPSPYTRFEGGFCGEYFFYCASSVQKDAVSSECVLLDKNGAFILRRADFDTVHAQVDESGICFSVGNRVLLIDLEMLNWRSLDRDTGYNVRLMRNMRGRVLVVTEDSAVYLYDTEGRRRSVVSDDIPYTIAEFRGEYLVLVDQTTRALSVWKWEDGYLKSDYLPYDATFEHQWASVHSDMSSAMLFRLNQDTVFAIFDADGHLIASQSLEDWRDILYLRYQRIPTSPDEPNGDCLRVEYADRIDFYSAKDGQRLKSLPREIPVSYQSRVFQTERYRVENLNGGRVAIYAAHSGKYLTALDAYQLLDVSENGGHLVLSFLTIDYLPHSLLLNEKLEVIADIDGSCEILPDGRLSLDDREGHLIASRIYTLRDLLAEKTWMWSKE